MTAAARYVPGLPLTAEVATMLTVAGYARTDRDEDALDVEALNHEARHLADLLDEPVSNYLTGWVTDDPVHWSWVIAAGLCKADMSPRSGWRSFSRFRPGSVVPSMFNAGGQS